VLRCFFGRARGAADLEGSNGSALSKVERFQNAVFAELTHQDYVNNGFYLFQLSFTADAGEDLFFKYSVLASDQNLRLLAKDASYFVSSVAGSV